MQPMRRTLARVVGSQPLAQPVRLDAYDRVGILIEGGSPMEDFHSYRILLDLTGFPGEQPLAQVPEKMSERRRAHELLRAKHRLQLSALCFQLGRLSALNRHHSIPD
jgi:hypothetical protein